MAPFLTGLRARSCLHYDREPPRPCSPREFGRKERKAAAPAGSRSQRSNPRPSPGSAAANVRRCWARCRRLVRPSATASQTPTICGFHPRSAAIRGASRRLRSSAERSPCTSTMRDLTSTMSKASGRMPGQDVHGAAFPVDREGCFRDHGPAYVPKDPQARLNQPGVGRIKQPIDVAAPPPRPQLDPHAERLSNRTKNTERESRHQPTLDA